MKQIHWGLKDFEGMMCFGNFLGGWSNQCLDAGLMCSLGMDINMFILVVFDMYSVLVVVVFDMCSLFVVIVFDVCSLFVEMKGIVFIVRNGGFIKVVVWFVYIRMSVGYLCMCDECVYCWL